MKAAVTLSERLKWRTSRRSVFVAANAATRGWSMSRFAMLPM
jgi:hypothetical protein